MAQRAGRAARRWARLVLFAALGLIVLLALLLVALRTSFAREQVRGRVNAALGPLFRGRIELDRLGAITLHGVSGVDARVFDPSGKQVIRVQGLSVVASLPSLGWQLLAHGDQPALTLSAVHVDHVDVALRDDEDVGVSLAAAFLPRPAAPTATSSAPSAQGPRLRVEGVLFEHIWAHGRIRSSPALDVDLKRLVAALSQSQKAGFSLDLRRVELVARGLPGQLEPSGQATGKLVVPGDAASPLQLEATFTGRAAGSSAEVAASWVGDELHAQVSLPELPAERVNQLVPALQLDGTVNLRAALDGALPVLGFTASAAGTAAQLDASGYAVVEQGLEFAATLEATRIDAACIVPQAPHSDLQLKVQAFAFEESEDDFVVAQRVELGAGSVGRNATPPLWLNGKGRWDPAGKLSGSGQLGLDDAGLALRGHYHLTLPQGPGGVVAATLQAELNDPARLQKLGLRAAGHGELSAELRLGAGSITGQTTLNLRHLEHTLVSVRNLELTARASGTLDQPRLRAETSLDVLSGRAHAHLDYSKSHQELALSVSDIDLVRFSNHLGSKLPLEQARLRATAYVTRQAPASHYQVNARAILGLGKLGVARLTATDLELPTTLSQRAHFGDLQGELVVDGQVRLEALSPLLTRAHLPIERTTGNVRFELAAKHKPADPQGLELSVALDTLGLRVIQERKLPETISTTADARASQPLAVESIDLHFSAHARPRTGDAFGTLILRDPEGTLADVQAATQLPESWPLGLTDKAALARLPFKVHLEVPRRKLASLPSLLRPAALRGKVALEANWEGSLAEPRLTAQVSAQSLHAAGSKALLDVNAELDYAPERGQCQVQATLAGQSSQVASVKANWQGDLSRAALQPDGKRKLVGSIDAVLAEFPLDVLPFVLDRQVAGRVSGKLALQNWGQDARLDATFESTSLSVGTMPVRELKASARTDASKLVAELGLKVGTGTAHASLDSSMRWGERPLPELTRQGSAKIETEAFDLASLNPLLASYVSEIGGRLDAKAQLAVTPAGTELSGSAKLEKGVVQVPAIGQRFSDIQARMVVADRKFKLQDLSARGTTGRVTGNASASFDGFELRAAEAQLTIPKNESLPLTLEGATLGDVWGSVNANYARPANGERKLAIELPSLHLITPESSGYDLQSLNAPADIRVGVRRADGKFTALPIQPLEPTGTEGGPAQAPAAPLHIRVRLGQDVTVERGKSVSAQLAGELELTTGAQTDVSGRIEVRGGKLDVSGKRFDLERGVVTFEGDDPGNPTVTATARWDGPEYTVYADYVGDVKNGRIKLRSEPPLTPNEIANVLLFGSPEGSAAGSAQPNTGALAVGLAGDTAAKGLNQVLDDFTKLDVSARVDTTTGDARPELVFQVSQRVSARVTRAIGAPLAGEALDRTFLTLELRLQRAWALSAVFGDHGGSALDLIWRRRY